MSNPVHPLSAGVVAQPTKVRISVALPESLVVHYEEAANKRRTALETVLRTRLERCRDHDAERAIYFDDQARQQLERISATQLHTADDVIALVSRLLTVRADGIEIALRPATLMRLKSRALGVEFKDFLQRVLTNELEAVADGLR
jgi:hypothetical protein